MKALKICTVLISLALVGCANTTSRTHPTLDQELLQVERVVIAPPDVEVTLITFTGENERMTTVEESLSLELMTLSQSFLTNQGYEVVEFDFAAARAEDAELATLLGDFNAAYDQAKKDLKAGQMISEAEASSVRSTLGEAAILVADEADADAVLLVRFAGFDKSEGQVAKDLGTSILVGVLTMGTVVPIMPTSGAVMEVALIDGGTGDVLWTDMKQGNLSAAVTNQVMATLPEDIDEAAANEAVVDAISQ